MVRKRIPSFLCKHLQSELFEESGDGWETSNMNSFVFFLFFFFVLYSIHLTIKFIVPLFVFSVFVFLQFMKEN